MKKAMMAILAMLLVAGFAVADSGLSVQDAVICTGVVDRAPEGAAEEFPADVGKLYCFTRIVGAADETTVTHVWIWGDEEVASVELKVGTASWRTHSSKNIWPGWKGDWKVEVRDAEGNVLKTLNFKVVAAAEEE